MLERRLRAEKEHQTTQSRNRCKELEAALSRLQEQLQTERSRNKDLDEEFAKYRQAQRSTPSPRERRTPKPLQLRPSMPPPRWAEIADAHEMDSLYVRNQFSDFYEEPS